MISKKSGPTQIVNSYLDGIRISKNEFYDFKTVVETLRNVKEEKLWKILDWFRFLHEIEIPGWRPRNSTRKMAHMLLENDKLHKLVFYALFCPSYKKGKEEFGFRTDNVGETTLSGIKNLILLDKKTREFGFYCEKPISIFFDLAIEQADKVIAAGGLRDLEKNIINFKNHLPDTVSFERLSEIAPNLFNQIGYEGKVIEPLLVSNKIFLRIVKRGKLFYQLFGWNDEQIIERSKIVATSEALTGNFLRNRYKNGIMVYTPTMLERSMLYSDNKLYDQPPPIVFPNKSGS